MRKKNLLSDGTKPASVTTVIDNNLGWNKGVLINWYYNTMKLGQDPKKINAYSKKLGTLCHSVIESIEDKKVFTTELLEKLDITELLMKSSIEEEYIFIKEKHKIEIVSKELTLLSEVYRFIGRLDLLANINTIPTLLDVKTSKDIYADHIIQLSAYRMLLRENNYDIKQSCILSIDKKIESDERMHLHYIPDELLDKGEEVFKMLLQLNVLKEKLVYDKSNY